MAKERADFTQKCISVMRQLLQPTWKTLLYLKVVVVIATEATKHFSDARAYSSILTNSAGAQTVNLLITNYLCRRTMF